MAGPHTRKLHVDKVGDGRVTSGSLRIDCGTVCTTYVKAGLLDPAGREAGPGLDLRRLEPTVPRQRCVRAEDERGQRQRDRPLQGGLDVPTGETRELTVKPTGTGSGHREQLARGDPLRAPVRQQLPPRASEVVLKEVAADGSRFTGWGGGCGGAQALPGRAERRRHGHRQLRDDLDAPFDLTLTVNPVGEGSGTVVSRPASISCGQRCSATFPKGTTVTLAATPGAGAPVFEGWEGAGCSRARVCTVTLHKRTTTRSRPPSSPAPPSAAHHVERGSGEHHAALRERLPL